MFESKWVVQGLNAHASDYIFVLIFHLLINYCFQKADEAAIEETNTHTEQKKCSTLYDKMTEMPGYGSIADLLCDKKAVKATLVDVIRNPSVSNLDRET